MFWYQGKQHDIPLTPWKLLKAMWGQKEGDSIDVADEIWDVPDIPFDSSLRSATSTLKKCLRKAGYPEFIAKVRNEALLVWKTH